ncbi:MAG: HAD family hydrolase [Acidobacteriota bacterium]
MEERLGLRAVIFDYGMVLTGKPDADAHDAMVRITGLAPEHFERLYWADRHAYDEGKLTGVTFWQKLARDGLLDLPQDALDDLNALDARMWTTCDARMVEWQATLKKRGMRTAILSNMGDAVLANIERTFAWIQNFDVLVWSYQLGMAKPDPAIYRHTLERLQTAPEETLFIDDKRENIEVALALGMRGIVFTTPENLCAQIREAGLEKELPLP